LSDEATEVGRLHRVAVAAAGVYQEGKRRETFVDAPSWRVFVDAASCRVGRGVSDSNTRQDVASTNYDITSAKYVILCACERTRLRLWRTRSSSVILARLPWFTLTLLSATLSLAEAKEFRYNALITIEW